MRKLKKEKKEFNKAYIPVIISSILLIILVIGLVIVLLNDPEETKKHIAEGGEGEFSVIINDMVLDGSKTSCDKKTYQELLKAASDVDVTFDVTTVESEEKYYDASFADEGPGYEYQSITYDAYDLKITNITDDISVKITDPAENKVITFKKDDIKDGVATYTVTKVLDIQEYTVTITSKNKSCTGDVIRKFSFKTPSFNVYANIVACENKDSKDCSLVTYDTINVQKILDESVKDASKKEEEEKGKAIRVNIIIAILVVAVVVASIVVIYIQHRKKVKKHV